MSEDELNVLEQIEKELMEEESNPEDQKRKQRKRKKQMLFGKQFRWETISI
ncbi:hypothetical protein [Neobacillus notoginsengisoli]|uniref:hypothetical protein n=1 Tax=Neobacillus notoginsengisoli TaxID=1578198 RepID=UPI0013148337|nr:hypothetical protein [Neobacillus notoginsengisoli]